MGERDGHQRPFGREKDQNWMPKPKSKVYAHKKNRRKANATEQGREAYQEVSTGQ